MPWDTFRIQKRQALARSWLAGVSPSPFFFFIKLKNEKELPIFTAAAHHLLKITTPSAPRTTTKKHTQVLPHWAKGKKKLLLQFLPKFLAPTNFYLMRGAAKTQDSCCILCLLEQAVSNADFFREETGIFLYRLEPSLPLLIFSL